MSITTVIIIALLAIMAGALVVIAMASIRAGDRYDRDMDLDYANIRADMDRQSDEASK